MVKGSDKVETTFLLAAEIEYILLAVKSNLKKRVMPATFINTTMIRYIINLIYFSEPFFPIISCSLVFLIQGHVGSEKAYKADTDKIQYVSGIYNALCDILKMKVSSQIGKNTQQRLG